MKIRNGFVSNSSTSSFIIAIRKDKEVKSSINLSRFDFLEYLEYFENEDKLRIKNIGFEDISKYLECSLDKETLLDKMSKQGIERDDEKFNLVHFELGLNDPFTYRLYSFLERKGVIVTLSRIVD